MCCLWFQGFIADTRKHYSAELESLDFIKSSEAARLNINNWVENQTQGGVCKKTSMFQSTDANVAMNRKINSPVGAEIHEYKKVQTNRGQHIVLLATVGHYRFLSDVYVCI